MWQLVSHGFDNKYKVNAILTVARLPNNGLGYLYPKSNPDIKTNGVLQLIENMLYVRMNDEICKDFIKS